MANATLPKPGDARTLREVAPSEMEKRPIIVVREMCADDARQFLVAHHESVRGIAAKDYPPQIVEEWAPMPISDEAVELVAANPNNEVRIVAEIDGQIVGIAVIIPKQNELRACYVVPKAARMGVGSALVSRLEQIALKHGLKYLELVSSITAEPFYASLGYDSLGRSQHVLSTGGRMACVKMSKPISN
jgi:putative acetyltransferase